MSSSVFSSVFQSFLKVFLKTFSQKILQDGGLVAKAMHDGVDFLARSCGGATRSSAPLGTGIEPVAPALADPRCELRYPLGHWRIGEC